MEANASVDMFSKVLENQLLQTTKLVEEHLDSEIQKLDQMDEDELERLKEKRLEALKKAQQQKQEWLSKGHGEYREIPSERDFFQEVKESKKVVCHFYRDSTFRCKILDRHLVILSKKHLETKFLKLNVEKAPFLCERLRIKVIPTLALVKDGKTQDFVVGFSDLGNTDDFTTETLEWRLGCSDILNYRGGLPWWLSGKEYACQCRRHVFNPWEDPTCLRATKPVHKSLQLWSLCSRAWEPQLPNPCATATEGCTP
uniref:Thioredoxin domain containing 9 n=1 Tax=Ovis aries TaxID=9940 RepID=A0AC11DUW9_SHEEP